MNPQAIANSLIAAGGTLSRAGTFIQIALFAAAAALASVSLIPSSTQRRRLVLAITAAVLIVGLAALAWFHWRIYVLAVVVDPSTSRLAGHIAIPLWVESEKLYVWALIVALMGLALKEARDDLMPGIGLTVTALIIAAMLWGRPFGNPLPSFFGQYFGYLQAMASGVAQDAQTAFSGMESARQFYYNSWYMWAHPLLLFISYGAFVIAFIATVLAIVRKRSFYEKVAYHWARIGYVPLTAGILLGFPWAIAAWRGEAWWWSGKVNMSLMMWLLYTAYLHGRLYLHRRGMWRWVLALAVLSFVVLLLSYLATYVVPGAHSYA